MNKFISEDDVENITLDTFRALGYEIVHGPDISPDGISPERNDYSDVVLVERLRRAIDQINPDIPAEAKEEAIKKVLRTESPKLIVNNHELHILLVDGVDVEFRKDGRIVGDKVYLFDFKNTDNNEFLAVNQFTVIENNINRRPDVVIFVNGLPLAVIELKNPADEEATIYKAFTQLQTYKKQITSLFEYNELLVISDGFQAMVGTITSGKTRFMKWKTIDSSNPPKDLMELEVLIKGMFEKSRLLDIVRHFIVFEKEKELQKKLAAYHQYCAVNKAVESTKRAIKDDKKAGLA